MSTAADSRPRVAIGIDLGTTYSCVGVYKDNAVQIIPTADGDRTVPSFVSFADNGDMLVGHTAKDRAHLHPRSTVFDSKRLIGRRYDDPMIENDKKLWPFALTSAPNNSPLIAIGDDRHHTPEQISSFILAHLRAMAQAYVGESGLVSDAVITVPAYFSDAQRAATKEAGLLAGLNVTRIINEPTAAAIAYGLQSKLNEHSSGEKFILIFDLGGGTFDVSLLSIEHGIFEVKATAGDTHLGGEDFDQRIMQWVIDQLTMLNNDLKTNEKLLRKLRSECELAKRNLSSMTETTITVANIATTVASIAAQPLPPHMKYGANNDSLSLTLTRAQFESLCQSLFHSTLEPVEQVLRDAKIAAYQINEVVLVGGSTRIPKIQSMLSNYFDGKKLNNSIDPDEAVAYGATIQAALLSGAISSDSALSSILLIDVTPLSLGVEINGGFMNTIIDRNTIIPCRRISVYTTHTDYQQYVTISVYEGERVRTCDNLLLGSFELGPLPASAAGKLKIEVTFLLDVNGILSVSAVETSTETTNSITVAWKDRLSNESDCDNDSKFGEIARLLADSAIHAETDSLIASRATAKFGLENFIFSANRKLNDRSTATNTKDGGIDANEEATVRAKLSEVEHWLGVLGNDDGDEKLFESKQSELEALIVPYLTKIGLIRVRERMEKAKQLIY